MNSLPISDRVAWQQMLRVVLSLLPFLFCESAIGQDSNRFAVPSELLVQNRANPKAASYNEWISQFRNGFASVSFKLGVPRLEMTEVFGDGPAADHFLMGPVLTRRGVALSADGNLSWFMENYLQGSRPIAQEDLVNLDKLLTDLPDDHSLLPPPGHRLLVQLVTKGRFIARVYDLANLPEQIVDMVHGLRLVGNEQIRLIVPKIKPDRKWEGAWKADIQRDAGVVPDELPFSMLRNSTLAVSPDRKIAVKSSEALWTMDPAVHFRDSKNECHSIPGTDLAGNTRIEIRNSNDGSLLRDWDEPATGRCALLFYRGWFTPDGNYLLLQSNIPSIRIYDTKAWKPVEQLPDMPADAVSYRPSSDWKHAIFVSRTGEIDLWDTVSRRCLALYEPNEELKSVAFSPDDSIVAIVTIGHNKERPLEARLILWETQSGRFLRELMVLEQSPGIIEAPTWYGNKYLMASTYEHPNFSTYAIGIWNVETGRYSGDLWGCWDSNVSLESQFYIKNGRLFQECKNDMYEWDLDKVRQTLESPRLLSPLE